MSAARRTNRADVLRLVRSVRRRWRFGVGLRGLAMVVGITGLVVFLSAMGLERLRFSPEAVFWFRLLTWSTLGASIVLFVVRPAAIMLSTAGVGLALNERLLLAWIAPRGVVAAAVAGIFGPRLVAAGYPDGALLVALVFATILVTVVVQTSITRR